VTDRRRRAWGGVIGPAAFVTAWAANGAAEAAALSLAAGVIAGLSLAATALGPTHGLFQRLGLTIGDIWLAASAVAILRRPALSTQRYVTKLRSRVFVLTGS
jgi:hypothetical protein